MDSLQIPFTALYAGVMALILVALSLRVSFARARFKITIMDGGNEELQRRIRVHGNFAEFVPLALVLMLIVEIAGAPGWAIHAFGLVLLAARLLHAYGLGRSAEVNFGRAVGSLLTSLVLVVAGVYAIYIYTMAQLS